MLSHTYDAVLLVIDMQKYFPTANDPMTILGCQKEVKRAMAKGHLIVFVEYRHWDLQIGKYGHTHAKITNLAKHYPHKMTVGKFMDDGSDAITMALKKADVKVPKIIRVCGVNIDACVRGTVTGLAWSLDTRHRIGVVKKAVNGSWPSNDWQNFPFWQENNCVIHRAR